MNNAAKYTIEYTEMIPGGDLYRQCDIVHAGDRGIAAVGDYLDKRDVWGKDPIVVTEHTQSDGIGRIVPASEWDVCED
jgi:hypothetical protein